MLAHLEQEGERVRYSEFAAGVSGEDEHTLVNALTLGSGWLALAVRVLTTDGDATTVLRVLTRAAGALLLARRMLNGQATDAEDGLVLDLTDVADAGETAEPTALSWGDFLATRPLEGAAVRPSLLNAVVSTRRAGRALLDDGEVETMRLHLAEAVSCLGDARRSLT